MGDPRATPSESLQPDPYTEFPFINLPPPLYSSIYQCVPHSPIPLPQKMSSNSLCSWGWLELGNLLYHQRTGYRSMLLCLIFFLITLVFSQLCGVHKAAGRQRHGLPSPFHFTVRKPSRQLSSMMGLEAWPQWAEEQVKVEEVLLWKVLPGKSSAQVDNLEHKVQVQWTRGERALQRGIERHEEVSEPHLFSYSICTSPSAWHTGSAQSSSWRKLSVLAPACNSST